MKKKLLITLALVLVIGAIFCAFVVTAEGAVVETEPTTEESSGVAADEPVLGGGNWINEHWDVILNVVTNGLSWLGAIVVAVIGRKVSFMKTPLQKVSINNENIKGAVNDMIDEIAALDERVKEMRNTIKAVLDALVEKEANVAMKNDAVCKTISALISASSLPDEVKNHLLGDMNSALGYKDGESNDDQDKG